MDPDAIGMWKLGKGVPTWLAGNTAVDTLEDGIEDSGSLLSAVGRGVTIGFA